MEIYFAIGGFFLLFILLNVSIYYYLKYKRRIFLNFIKDRAYILTERVEMDIEGQSKLGSKLTYRKADIIFLDGEIFILTFNKSIIQLTRTYKAFPGVFSIYFYRTKLMVKDRLEIKNPDGSLTFTLHMKNKNFNLEPYVKDSE